MCFTDQLFCRAPPNQLLLNVILLVSPLRGKCPKTDQKKLRIWTLFTQRSLLNFKSASEFCSFNFHTAFMFLLFTINSSIKKFFRFLRHEEKETPIKIKSIGSKKVITLIPLKLFTTLSKSKTLSLT